MTKKQVEEERVYLAYSSIIVHHGMQSEQELKQGWNLEAGAEAEAMMEECCLLTRSACFLIVLRATSAVVAPPTESQTVPYQSSMNKLHHRLTHR